MSTVEELVARCFTQYLRIVPRSTVTSAVASGNGAGTRMCAVSPTRYDFLSGFSAIEVLLEAPQSVAPSALTSIDVAVVAAWPLSSFDVATIRYSPPVVGVKFV